MLENVTARFASISRDAKGDQRFGYWEISSIREAQIRSVPIRIDETKRLREDRAPTWRPAYTEQGLKNFWPWFILNKNSSDNNDYLDIVIELLKKIDPPENKRLPDYTYVRGDVNIFMPWIRVHAFRFLLLIKCLDDLLDTGNF